MIEVLKDSQVSSEVIEAIGKTNFTPIHMAIQGVFNNIFYGYYTFDTGSSPFCAGTMKPVRSDKNNKEKQYK